MNKFKIYIITNDVNNKVYIGQTTDSLNHRFNQHCHCSSSNMYEPINSIGKEHFKISLLDDSASDLDELLLKEQYYVQKYNSLENGYNRTFPCKTKGKIHDSKSRKATSVKSDLYIQLKSLSIQTGVPIIKLIDKAIAMYLESVKRD